VSGSEPQPQLFRPADEGRHAGDPLRVPPPVERWSFWAGPLATAPLLVVHLTFVPGEGRASFAAAVRQEPEYAVVLVAADLVLPSVGLELRGPGIWADHTPEEPFERWSLGLEAFAVGVEVDVADDLEVLLVGSGTPELRGDRVPIGWDLEWISDEPLVAEGPCAYHVGCRVEGELLLGVDAIELDELGGRRHSW
jgi:hypothetical protein